MGSLPSNYYDFFGLEHRLDLDLRDLEKRFYALSREHHPDRFSLKSREEQQRALNATAILNDAYRTLRDPLARAEYLLKEHGRVTATLTATSFPRRGIRWIEMDNNFSLQNLLIALLDELGLRPDG